MRTELQGFVAIVSKHQKSLVWPIPGEAQEERGWERGMLYQDQQQVQGAEAGTS